MENPNYKFKVGERVRVKLENPLGNPRTPRYVRGKQGVIVAVHGVINNPHDHRGLYPPLYTLVFGVNEVFGTPNSDKLWVDVHEEWLESA
jgi:nitrile hydratase